MEYIVPGNPFSEVKRVVCTIELAFFQAPSAFVAGMKEVRRLHLHGLFGRGSRFHFTADRPFMENVPAGQ
jgi:hypothetical protein